MLLDDFYTGMSFDAYRYFGAHPQGRRREGLSIPRLCARRGKS